MTQIPYTSYLVLVCAFKIKYILNLMFLYKNRCAFYQNRCVFIKDTNINNKKADLPLGTDAVGGRSVGFFDVYFCVFK